MIPNILHRLTPWVPPLLIELGWRLRARGGAPFALPTAALGDLFPTADAADVVVPASQYVRTRDMMLPLADLVAVGAICQAVRPRRVFEIGTFTGSTTLVIAKNTPAESEIFTLDLPEAEFAAITGGRFTLGGEFRHSPEAGKIRQMHGRSEMFDFAQYRDTVDLVFVDAVHTHEAVTRDTATALALLRPGGVLIWDDYRWLPEHAECAGVTRAVNAFARTAACFQLAGTRLAVHLRASGGGG